jgi:hypothetical protein
VRFIVEVTFLGIVLGVTIVFLFISPDEYWRSVMTLLIGIFVKRPGDKKRNKNDPNTLDLLDGRRQSNIEMN